MAEASGQQEGPWVVVVGDGKTADVWVRLLGYRGAVARADSVADAVEAGADVVLLTNAPYEACVALGKLLEGGGQVLAAASERGAHALAGWLGGPDATTADQDQDRLMQAARLADVGQLAGGIAHEINTPLASIALRAESLARQAEDRELQAVAAFKNFPRYLKTIQEETFRCKKIISSLVEFARGRAPDVREIDVDGPVGRAVDLLRHEAKVRGAELALELAEGLPRLKADEARLTQVVVALVMNALQAVPRGGHVRVETRGASAKRIEIVVEDDGGGIPPEIRGSVFTPFFTTKPPGQGTGLGLAICHGIVTAHGGDIRLETEPGRGTRLTVGLPVGTAT